MRRVYCFLAGLLLAGGLGGAEASARPATALSAADSVDLDFERSDSPRLWSVGNMGKMAADHNGGVLGVDSDVAHRGSHSLRVVASDTLVMTSIALPLERVRGKWVRISGWIRTRNLTGSSALWLRVDAPKLPGVRGDVRLDASPPDNPEWTRYELDVVDVPRDASAVLLGASANGTGTLWLDDLDVAVWDRDPRRKFVVRGTVGTAAHERVPDACVAAVHAGDARPSRLVRSRRDGTFEMRLPAGRWSFTATSEVGVAAYRETESLQDATKIDLLLGTEGFTVTGQIESWKPIPRDLAVCATRQSDVEGDLFIALPDAVGRYRLRLPVARGYRLELWGDGVANTGVPIDLMVDQKRDLNVIVPGPPPTSVVRWVKKAAIPLTGVEAGQGFADMEPLGDVVGDARIVALGEATHGTREFFQMKHRMLEYLVERKGFRIFAIEANLTEARRVNDYVLHREGKAADALAGLYFWTWDTEEVLALIEWMRAYNADPAHSTPVQFLGFDMQTTSVAAKNVMTFLSHAGAPVSSESLEPFLSKDIGQRWRGMKPEVRARCRAAADSLVAWLDSERSALAADIVAADWRAAREDARLLAQAGAMFEDSMQGFTAGFNDRDRAMAENVRWILNDAAPGNKVVLWAHNSHIAFEMRGYANMGSELHATFGRDYLPIGFVFASGAFQARGGPSSPKGTALQHFELGPPPDSDVSTAFTRAGQTLCALDLRRAPEGEVARWFYAPHAMRELGAGFAGEAFAAHDESLARRFSAVFFVAHTTAARANPTGRRDS